MNLDLAHDLSTACIRLSDAEGEIPLPFRIHRPRERHWARTWYETDDVYVEYVNDGYYMYSRRHPGVAIAVNVSF